MLAHCFSSTRDPCESGANTNAAKQTNKVRSKVLSYELVEEESSGEDHLARSHIPGPPILTPVVATNGYTERGPNLGGAYPGGITAGCGRNMGPFVLFHGRPSHTIHGTRGPNPYRLVNKNLGRSGRGPQSRSPTLLLPS